MREIQDETGRRWQVLAIDQVVAHGRQGTALGFQPTDELESDPLLASVSFNSKAAGEFAINSMSEKELRRRLTLARATAGVA